MPSAHGQRRAVRFHGTGENVLDRGCGHGPELLGEKSSSRADGGQASEAHLREIVMWLRFIGVVIILQLVAGGLLALIYMGE
jgi:hypothetical protein